MLRSTFSMTTMASSTTRPMASTMAKSVRVLMVKSKRTKAPKVAMRDTGTANMGMIVARQLWRNRKTMSMTKSSASTKVCTTSSKEARMYSVLSTISMYFMSGGKFGSASAMIFLTALTVSMALASLVSWTPKARPT